jgi:uncharacterized protein YkvS
MMAEYQRSNGVLSRQSMKVGDLVKLKDGTTGIIMEIVTDNPMARRHPWVILHCGEKFSMRDLEVINESR